MPEALLNLKQLHDIAATDILLKNPLMIDLACATVLANRDSFIEDRKKKTPIWLVFISPPATGKTSVLLGAETAGGAAFLNKITDKTLFSGLSMGAKNKKRNNKSLITKLTNREISTVVNLDMGNIFSLSKGSLAEVLQQFRQVFDGVLSAAWGSGEEVIWKGYMGFLGGCTDVIDDYHNMITRMGDRFLFYRPPVPSADDMARLASREDDSFLEDAMDNFMQSGDFPNTYAIEMPEEIRFAAEVAAKWLARARASAMWDYRTGALNKVKAPEGPGRIVKGLLRLARGLAATRKKKKVGMQELADIRAVAWDSAPRVRTEVLECIQNGAETLSAVASALMWDPQRVRRTLKELLAIGEITSFSEESNKKGKNALEMLVFPNKEKWNIKE